jgi:uncharacterized membrane protein YebE (DUF533 family)
MNKYLGYLLIIGIGAIAYNQYKKAQKSKKPKVVS